MADPREAVGSLQPPGMRPGVSVSGDKPRHSTSSAGGSSMYSGSTHVGAASSGYGTDSAPSHEHTRTTGPSTSTLRASSRRSASPTPPSRRDAFVRPGTHRPHRNGRSSGAFLLSDPLAGARPSHDQHDQHDQHRPGRPGRHALANTSTRANRISTQDHSVPAPPVTPEHRGPGQQLVTPGSSGADSTAEADATMVLHSPLSSESSPAPVAPVAPSMDLDSAQIVNMALNLSESRRLAARRNVSQPIPPRLSPLPDSAVGGSLLRQLQQQRRISRNISPRPERTPSTGRRSPVSVGPGPTVPATALRTSSTGGLPPPAFDPMGDPGTYRYHFSPSTLARAQKAKEYLELLAQQRRLLAFLPPLTPAPTTQKRTSALVSPPPPPPPPSSNGPAPGSTPGSTVDLGGGQPVPVGRPYNPLQYIRNRKVRVRERRTIDGQALGFGDVARASSWVDEVARWTATNQNRQNCGPGWPSLPPFASADAATAALSSSPPPASLKPKRQRIDWMIDPADMLADVYWLEQGDNKMLVEDRQWRRVFPQDPSHYRPTALKAPAAPKAPKTDDAVGTSSEDVSPYVPATYMFMEPSSQGSPEMGSGDVDYGSTRKRARQKLSELKSFHHRHSSSVQGHEFGQFGRPRRASFSDSSDSDTERGFFGRRRKDGKDGKDDRAAVADAKSKTASGQASQEFRSSVLASPATKGQSAPSTGKPDLDSSVNEPAIDMSTGKRRSMDYDSSLPTSPELRPQGDAAIFVPALGESAIPASRFGKVKHMFRDRSSERERARERTNSSAHEHALPDKDKDNAPLASGPAGADDLPAVPEMPETHSMSMSPSVGTGLNRAATTNLEAKGLGSTSPMRKALSRSNTSTFELHRPHGSITSLAGLRSHGHALNRTDESGTSTTATIRGMFRGGPRIDTMLRSGVSKVGDMFWRRDGSEALDGDAGHSSAGNGILVGASSADDDSDADVPRGRSRSPSAADHKAGEPHYLDIMPTFSHEQRDRDAHKLSRLHRFHLSPSPDPVSRPASRRSARFDLLKPPRIDVHEATPTPVQMQDSEVSESEAAPSRRPSHTEAGDDAEGGCLEVPMSMSEMGGEMGGDGAYDGYSGAKRLRWSVSQPAYGQQGGSLSRREVARLRATMFSSAVLARELARRAHEPKVLAGDASTSSASSTLRDGRSCMRRRIVGARGESMAWSDVAAYSTTPDALLRQPIPPIDMYRAASQVLAGAVQRSGRSWTATADAFHNTTLAALHARIGAVRTRVDVDLAGLARSASDEADAVSQDLAAVQQQVVAGIEAKIGAMLRRRRRRFRWVRRAGWLTVEWLVISSMWCAWFVVTLARMVLCVLKCVASGVRWLLWL